MRVAALVTRPGPEELLVALPNTVADEARVARVARVVEEGLCEAIPEVASGIATYRERATRARTCCKTCEPLPDSTWWTLNYPRFS